MASGEWRVTNEKRPILDNPNQAFLIKKIALNINFLFFPLATSHWSLLRPPFSLLHFHIIHKLLDFLFVLLFANEQNIVGVDYDVAIEAMQNG